MSRFRCGAAQPPNPRRGLHLRRPSRVAQRAIRAANPGTGTSADDCSIDDQSAVASRSRSSKGKEKSVSRLVGHAETTTTDTSRPQRRRHRADPRPVGAGQLDDIMNAFYEGQYACCCRPRSSKAGLISRPPADCRSDGAITADTRRRHRLVAAKKVIPASPSLSYSSAFPPRRRLGRALADGRSVGPL